MKTNYKHLLLILSLVLAVGCTKQSAQTSVSDENTDTNQLAVITGTILNRDLYPNQKTVKLMVPFFSDTETQCESLIDKDDSFSFTFNPYMLRTVSIETFVSHLLIAPGDTLHINIDFKHLDRVSFEGPAAARNTVYNAFIQEGWYKGSMSYSAVDNSIEAFEVLLKKDSEEQMEAYKEFAERYKPDALTDRWVRDRIELDKCDSRNSFVRQKAQFEKYTAAQLEEALAANDKRIAELLPHTLGDKVHFSILGQLSYRKAQAMIEKGDTTGGVFWRSIDQISDTLVRQHVIAANVAYCLRTNQTEAYGQCDSLIAQAITLPFLQEPLKQLIGLKRRYEAHPEELSDRLRGKNTIDGMHTGAAINGPGLDLLNNTIDNASGEVLFIDFWGNFCPPCMEGLAQWNQFTARFVNKPVRFVSFTMAQEERHAAILKKFDLDPSHHHIIEDHEWNEIMRRFACNFIPLYVLIDQKGVIVDYGAHLSPASPRTAEVIEQLLSK